MNFKCLLEILKEKEYIKTQYGELFITIKTEFTAVKEKILETLPDYAGYSYRDNRITITTVEDVEKFCTNLIKVEGKNHIAYINRRAMFTWYEYNAFLSAIEKSNRFEFKKDIANLDQHKIIDKIAKEKYIENKIKKQKEVEDFINSLP